MGPQLKIGAGHALIKRAGRTSSMNFICRRNSLTLTSTLMKKEKNANLQECSTPLHYTYKSMKHLVKKKGGRAAKEEVRLLEVKVMLKKIRKMMTVYRNN